MESGDKDKRFIWFTTAALVIAVVWNLGAVVLRDSPASSYHWDDVVEYFAQEHKYGEPIIFWPPVIDPVGRQYLGDRMTLDTVSAPDLRRFSTVWVVRRKGYSMELFGDGSDQSMGHSGKTVSEDSFGPLLVEKIEQEVVVPVQDLTLAVRDGLQTIKVTGKGSHYVGVEEVDFAPRQCIVLQPRRGVPLEMTLPAVALKDQVVGYVGLADVFYRRDVFHPVTVIVSVGKQSPQTFKLFPTSGWLPFSVDTNSAIADVTVGVFVAEGEHKKRSVCVALEVHRQ